VAASRSEAATQSKDPYVLHAFAVESVGTQSLPAPSTASRC